MSQGSQGLFEETYTTLLLITTPLPMDTSIGALYAILMDVSVQFMRLHNPLAARLIPKPGKPASEVTSFDFGFFATSQVM